MTPSTACCASLASSWASSLTSLARSRISSFSSVVLPCALSSIGPPSPYCRYSYYYRAHTAQDPDGLGDTTANDGGTPSPTDRHKFVKNSTYYSCGPTATGIIYP